MTAISITRASYNMALATMGWGAVGLGIAGLLIPGLPTTVFVLIAFYCFSKSSPNFAKWLLDHPWLGPSLKRHLADGGLSKSAKRGALAAMWTSILVSSTLLLHIHLYAALGTIALGAAGTIAIQVGVRTAPAQSMATAVQRRSVV